ARLRLRERRFVRADAGRTNARHVLARQPGDLGTAWRRKQGHLGPGRGTGAADNLFWLGRYVERVESAVRIARAILSRVNQESDAASAAGISAGVRILAALGHLPVEAVAKNGRASSDRDLMLEREMLTMIYDSGEKTSLGWTLSQLRRVAWLLRDRFS